MVTALTLVNPITMSFVRTGIHDCSLFAWTVSRDTRNRLVVRVPLVCVVITSLGFFNGLLCCDASSGYLPRNSCRAYYIATLRLCAYGSICADAVRACCKLF